MKKRWLTKRLYGIQKKMLLYMMLFLFLMITLIMLIVNAIIRRDIQENLTVQYGYVNDKFYQGFQRMYESLEAVTANCITNQNIQASLKNHVLGIYDQEVIMKTLPFMDNEMIDDYLYLDNKDHIYTRNTNRISFDKLKESSVYQGMGTEYSKVKLFWEENLFSDEKGKSVYAGRYVRPIERQYNPGLLVLKLEEANFQDMVMSIEEDASAYFLIDGKGAICFWKNPVDWNVSDREQSAVKKEILSFYQTQKHLESGVIGKHGLNFIKKHPESGFSIGTFVPDQTLYQVIGQMQGMLLFLLIPMLVISFLISRFAARRFTQPIRYISNLMEHFDDTHLNCPATLHTNTELDDIGNSYNQMLLRITQLIHQVTYKERELRKAEMDTLLYQIQPHFLYNTLDTVYMLARISKEETIMQMVQSLATYLRVNLSNGADEITIEEEVRHAQSYLEIQNIRGSGLFQYHIHIEEGLGQIPVMKMILQPIAENCIKHGFTEETDELQIWIAVGQVGDEIVFTIQNNGIVMSKKDQERLNRLEKLDRNSMDAVVTTSQGGFGICNVVKRLRLRYQEQIRFYYKISADQTSCVIKIRKECMTDEKNT